MAVFDELRAEYAVARDANLNHYHLCDIFARGLGRRLGTYIGAPETFSDIGGDPVDYIEAVEVEELNDGSYRSVKTEDSRHLIQRDENGYWLTGLRFTVDSAANEFPKHNFLFLIRFVLRERQCEMLVADSKEVFTFDIDDPNGPKPVYDLIVKILKDFFALPPWETKRKHPIGFVPPSER
jgi:hypothetical protein